MSKSYFPRKFNNFVSFTKNGKSKGISKKDKNFTSNAFRNLINLSVLIRLSRETTTGKSAKVWQCATLCFKNIIACVL